MTEYFPPVIAHGIHHKPARLLSSREASSPDVGGFSDVQDKGSCAQGSSEDLIWDFNIHDQDHRDGVFANVATYMVAASSNWRPAWRKSYIKFSTLC